jgi:hypothetical protein
MYFYFYCYATNFGNTLLVKVLEWHLIKKIVLHKLVVNKLPEINYIPSCRYEVYLFASFSRLLIDWWRRMFVCPSVCMDTWIYEDECMQKNVWRVWRGLYVMRGGDQHKRREIRSQKEGLAARIHIISPSHRSRKEAQREVMWTWRDSASMTQLSGHFEDIFLPEYWTSQYFRDWGFFLRIFLFSLWVRRWITKEYTTLLEFRSGV